MNILTFKINVFSEHSLFDIHNKSMLSLATIIELKHCNYWQKTKTKTLKLLLRIGKVSVQQFRIYKLLDIHLHLQSKTSPRQLYSSSNTDKTSDNHHTIRSQHRNSKQF
jgi:hypothetical protein